MLELLRLHLDCRLASGSFRLSSTYGISMLVLELQYKGRTVLTSPAIQYYTTGTWYCKVR